MIKNTDKYFENSLKIGIFAPAYKNSLSKIVE